jgi:hypothetical protein
MDVPRNGTWKKKRLLCGGRPRGDVLRGGAQNVAVMLRFWSRSCGNQNFYASVRRRCLNGLVAQITNRAGVRRSNSMAMPHSSERSPYHQHE